MLREMLELHQSIVEGSAAVTPSLLKPLNGLGLNRAIDIYRRGYRARLTEALGETYEPVWRVLGDELFFEVSEDYIRHHPSKSWTLSDYGNEFSEFLSEHDVCRRFEFLPDLAELCLGIHKVFHAKATPGLEADELARVLAECPEEIRLVEATEVILSRYAIFDIWRAAKEDAGELSEIERSQGVLIYKKIVASADATEPARAAKLYLEPMSLAQASLLVSLQGRETPSGFDSLDEISEEETAQLFQFLAENGLLTIGQ